MDEKNSAGKQLILLLLGIVMCGAGIFLFCNKVNVITTFGNGFGYWGMMGGRNLPGGMIVMPLIIGIVLMIALPKPWIGRIVSIFGVLFIILGVISSVNLKWDGSTLFEFIMILVLIFGGAALALRILLVPTDNDKK